MKIFLCGTLLLALTGAPVLAQDTGAPVSAPVEAKLQTEAAQLLTAQSVGAAIYIGYGDLAERKVGDNSYLTFEREKYHRLKGADETRFQGLLAPDAARAFLGKEVLVFARFDGKAKRGVITGILPATEANVTRVKMLVAANPSLEIAVTPSQTRYSLGEPIVVKWKITNVSGAPLSIFTGEDAARLNLNYGGSSHSWSDSAARQRPAFARLQPGQSWEYERTFAEEFPVGPVQIEYFYNAGDALKQRGDVPDDLFLEFKTGQAQTEVVPATAEQHAQILQRLKSPIWTQQLAAAQLVLQSQNAADVAKLEAFATHPDPKLRAIAALALIVKNKFSPELKRLYYAGTNLNWYARDAGDFTLAFFASNELNREAAKRGIFGKSRGLLSAFRWIDDPRTGDLLAARLRDEDRYGAELASIVGLRGEVQNTDAPLSPELKAKVLAAWETKRGTVKNLFTEAQLQSELNLARQIRYNDYHQGPFYDEVISILDDGQKIGFNASAEMDKINQRILALPPVAVLTLFEVMRWRGLETPPKSALQLLADSTTPDKFVRLAQIAYGRNGGDERVRAIELMAGIDFERARPHLEFWMKQAPVTNNWNDDAPRLGAAAVLAMHGDKRAVPVLLAPPTPGITTLNERVAVKALEKATGLSFTRMEAWRKWWEDEGAKMEWN